MRLFLQPLQLSVAAPNLYFCTMLKLNICFFLNAQQRQLADDEIEGEINSLHILGGVGVTCLPDLAHIQHFLRSVQ